MSINTHFYTCKKYKGLFLRVYYFRIVNEFTICKMQNLTFFYNAKQRIFYKKRVPSVSYTKVPHGPNISIKWL